MTHPSTDNLYVHLDTIEFLQMDAASGQAVKTRPGVSEAPIRPA